MRSDGRLTLAPTCTELFDAATAYLWGVAVDSHGTIYTGGGPGAKLFSVTAADAHKTVAEFNELEVHALAIDKSDRVYVGTSPDGKVYRVGSDGKASIFYDPKQKYIWAMALGPTGDLFVATGDHGEVHRVDPNGKGSIFFKTDETHARSLAFDSKGNLIVGTDPGGLVIRVDGAGKGFVLYQMVKREVTAIAATKDGSIYAAGAGSGAAGPILPVINQPAPATGIQIAITPMAAPPLSMAPQINTAAGTDVYRFDPEGRPEKIWNSAKDTVYAIAFDGSGRVLLGAGNRGTLYRVDTLALSTTLLSVESSQITALVSGPGGALYAATGNVGKVFRIGPSTAAEGMIESDVFDAGQFTQWGRVQADGDLHGGRIAVAARSGNLDRPGDTWSAWMTGDKPALPAARFVQWRATITGGAELDAVEVAYLPRNVAPRVEDIDITPANYKFGAAVTLPFAISTPATITLPAMGKHQTTATPAGAPDLSGGSMQFAKGWLGARWSASDENGDALTFKVEIRLNGDKDWKPLAAKVREKHVSFDSTAFPDGEYRLRITASDAPDNVAAEALSASEISAPFLIDNTAPAITGLRVIREANGLRVTWHAADALNVIQRAEYSLDGGEWLPVEPAGRLSDSLSLDYVVEITAAPGEHTVAVRVTDAYGNFSVK